MSHYGRATRVTRQQTSQRFLTVCACAGEQAQGLSRAFSETSTAMVKSVDLASLTTTLVGIITTSRSKLLSTKNGRVLKHALEAAAPICGCGESYAVQILDAVTSETSQGGRSHQLLVCNDLAMRQATKRLMIQACKYKNSTVVC